MLVKLSDSIVDAYEVKGVNNIGKYSLEILVQGISQYYKVQMSQFAVDNSLSELFQTGKLDLSQMKYTKEYYRKL